MIDIARKRKNVIEKELKKEIRVFEDELVHDGTIQKSEEKILVIPDVHGCLDELKALLERIDYHGECKLIFLGDFIDRGDKPFQTIQFIKELQKKYPSQVIVLRGNHEEMLIETFHEDSPTNIYSPFTIKDYKRNNGCLWDDICWFRSLPYKYETETHIFVHAGLKPKVPLEKQKHSSMIWIREEFIASDYIFPKNIVFGHTGCSLIAINGDRSNVPKGFRGKLALDTSCYFSGKLVCFDLSTLKYYYTYPIWTWTEEN